MAVRLDLFNQPERFHIGNDFLARGVALEAAIGLRHIVVQAGIGIEDIDQFEIMPTANLEIVEIMRRCDLHGPRALLRIGILVGHDNQPAADQRQHGKSADQTFPAFVVGVDGDRRVAEHSFRAGRGDGNEFVVAALDGIAEMPQMPVSLPRLDFEVGNRGEKFRIPIDQALVAVNQALFM